MHFESDRSEKVWQFAARASYTLIGSCGFGGLIVILVRWLVLPIQTGSYFSYYVVLALSPLFWWLSGMWMRQVENREGRGHFGLNVLSYPRAFLFRIFDALTRR